MRENEQITELLAAWSHGDESSLENLLPLVERELRRIAHRFMSRERADHTLQTTALINEAYLRLADGGNHDGWHNRAHFFAVSATIMRRILINYARDRMAEKRGGKNIEHINADEAVVFSPAKSRELIDLDEALVNLAKVDAVKSRIIELRYFGGLTIEETAEVLGIAPATVSLHWRLARAWLQKEIVGD